MTWQQLLAERRVQPHTTSRHELQDLRAVVARDLQDANLTGLSTDRKFATAYNAALQLAKMAIACAGYRVVGRGHHQTSFEALTLALGDTAAAFARYFEFCRRKRNQLDYDKANVITETEANELVAQAEAFRRLVEAWITQHYAQYAP